MDDFSAARTFIALRPPDDVRARLADAAQETLGSLRGLRVYPAQDLHLTLAFLGPVTGWQLRQLRIGLDTLAPNVGPFPVSTTHTGAFPGRGRERVLWAGVERDETMRALLEVALNASRCAACEPADADREPWTPHVTLARVREPGTLVPDAFYELRLDLAWMAREIAIFQPDPWPNTPRYRIVHSTEL